MSSHGIAPSLIPYEQGDFFYVPLFRQKGLSRSLLSFGLKLGHWRLDIV